MTAELPTLGVCLGTAELEYHQELVREAGRDVELQDFISAEVLTGDWRPLADKARRLLDGHEGRCGIHGPFWGFDLATSDPEVRPVVQRRLEQGLAVCEAIGGTHMVVHSPVSIWDFHNLDAWSDARDRLVDAFHQTVAPAVKRAADIGCTLMVENIADCDPALRVEMVAAFASPAIKVSVDTGHANYCHGRHNAPPVDYYVRAAGRELGHVHLQDTDGYADRHWPPGEGNIPWKAVFAVLHEATRLDEGGPDRPRLMLELRNKMLIPAAIEHLSMLGLAR